MASFLELWGTKLDRELGSGDRSSLFTTALRKEYVNEGQRKFNEYTACFVRRASVTVVDEQAEYDLESNTVITAADFLRVSKTSLTLKRYDGSGSVVTDYSYLEGPDLPYRSEEWLNQNRAGWRAESLGTPDCWTLREDGGTVNLVLIPGPDVTSGETWTVLVPYVAIPADMTADADVPWTASTNAKTTLAPYHEGILYWAAAQCELLRKNKDGHEWQMKRFSAVVAKYRGDMAPPRGSQMMLARNPFGSLRGASNGYVNPLRYP